MLTSANHPRWAGCRAGLWLQNAAVKIGPAPLVPHLAPDAKGIMVWRWPEPSAAGYELAGHAWPEQRGTALDRLTNVAVEIIGLSQRRTGRPRDGSRRPASTSWRTSFSECEGPSRTEAASPRPSGPSLTGPTLGILASKSSTPWIVDRPTSPLCIRRRMPISPQGKGGQPIRPVSTHWVARWASSAADRRPSLFLMCSRWDSIVLTLRFRVPAIRRVVRP